MKKNKKPVTADSIKKNFEESVNNIKKFTATSTDTIKKKFSISWYMSVLVIGELFVALALATLLSSWFSDISEGGLLGIPTSAWIVILGLLIGSTLSFVLNRLLLFPIRKLDRSMEEVAKGNFAIRLEEKSHYRDIEHIYKNFNLMTKELEANEMLKSDFISNVSHEIKTPITAIEGYAMLLQDADVSEEDAKYIEKILLNTGRLSELVGNILLLSKLDNQNIEAKSETFSLDEQIRQTILLLEPKWNTKNIEFDADLDTVSYCANSGIIMHVWYNLIGNAIKFSPDNSTVAIALKKDEEKITFTVKDSGPGIDEAVKERIFDKFYQCDSSHKSEGNGLGLSLVKRILDIYGGVASTENSPEGGCIFTVIMPLR